ncbi:unnamed protein product [Rotaria sp. Silwood1]|nr:unnamed protein product [Rotaria sp. Silwood1]
MEFDDQKKSYFSDIEKGFGEISLVIMQIINNKKYQSILSRSTIRTMFSLLHSQYINNEGFLIFIQAAHNLGENVCIDFILHYQSLQELKNNLESALGLQQGQFPEPAIEEKILKLIILLIKCSGISSEQHLMYSVTQLVQRKDQKNIQPSVEYIVRLLLDVPCFEIEQVGESSSMQLKPAFQKYESLRRVYDSKIIEMAMQCGFYMPPEQWSLLLYGYTTNESIIDPIIDKLLTKTSFQTAIQQYKKIVLLSGAAQSQDLNDLMKHFQFLSNDNLAIDASGASVLTSTLDMLKRVVSILNKLKK